MPKIRGIKPETWTDENFVELSPYARLLFIGLWNYACDNGHVQDKPKQLKLRILPADDVSCAELLREIESKGRITRNGEYLTIPTFRDHQKVDKRWFQHCDAPGCHPEDTQSVDLEPETRGGHVEATSGTRGGHDGASQGPLGDVDVDVDVELMVSGVDVAPKRRRRLPDDWAPNQQHHGYAVTNNINLLHEADNFRDHHRAKGTTMLDWDAAFRTWLRNAKKWNPATKNGNRHEPDPDAHIQRFLSRQENRA